MTAPHDPQLKALMDAAIGKAKPQQERPRYCSPVMQDCVDGLPLCECERHPVQARVTPLPKALGIWRCVECGGEVQP